jgi:uncharacterized lipoprotein YddW (UPF0748 family)
VYSPNSCEKIYVGKSIAIIGVVFVSSLLWFGCKEVLSGKAEGRGVWVSRYEYADANPAKAKARITEIFEQARRAKLNMVFFQIRGNGDAYYKSKYEPWAEPLTGELGKDPGWDPLEYAVGEAHRLGLELHAWINTFTVLHGTKPLIPTIPPSPYLVHPEWVVCDSHGAPMKPTDGYVFISPGIPAVRQYTINVALDIVNNYDVDGIHFDYIRYPEKSVELGYSHDSISVARFNSTEGNPDKLSWDDWEREQLNEFVCSAYNAITEAKPWVKVSAAVIGKYDGSGWTAYNSVYQDARRWMELGKMDFIVPMVYWDRDNPTHPFGPLISEWADEATYGRYVFPGIDVGLQQKDGWSEIVAEIAESREKKLQGVVFFSSSGLENSWKTLGTNEFSYWADIPKMAWKDSSIPPPPKLISVETTPGGNRVTWDAAGENGTTYFNVYRSLNTVVSTSDIKNIIAVSPRGASEFIDPVTDGSTWSYCVTAISRVGAESAPSNTVRASRPVATRFN